MRQGALLARGHGNRKSLRNVRSRESKVDIESRSTVGPFRAKSRVFRVARGRKFPGSGKGRHPAPWFFGYIQKVFVAKSESARVPNCTILVLAGAGCCGAQLQIGAPCSRRLSFRPLAESPGRSSRPIPPARSAPATWLAISLPDRAARYGLAMEAHPRTAGARPQAFGCAVCAVAVGALTPCGASAPPGIRSGKVCSTSRCQRGTHPAAGADRIGCTSGRWRP